VRRVQIVLGGTLRVPMRHAYLESLRLSDLAEKLIEHEEIMYGRRLPFVRDDISSRPKPVPARMGDDWHRHPGR
jgi:hypothetical protein